MNDRVVIDVLTDMATDGYNPPVLRLLIDHYDDYSEHLAMLKHVYRLYDFDDQRVSVDAWTEGQLQSKHWLLTELSKLDLDLGNIWVLCGWVGSLSLLISHHRRIQRYANIRSFDIDDRCARLADTLNRPRVLDGWKFKAATVDVNEIVYDDFVYTTKKYNGIDQQLVESCDTIINTSCDHMGQDITWWNRIPPDRLVLLQNNNWADNDQHDNSVRSINEFKDMYPMSELLYAGEIECTLYNRYMLIGRK